MKRIYTLGFLLLCAFRPGMAQQQISVTGRVSAGNGRPVPNATVGWEASAETASVRC